MKFQIGDTVQVGTRVGTITDIGTVLIQVKTNDGCLRMACPWEVFFFGDDFFAATRAALKL